ncbi:Tryptophan--tRNA ligase [uncultured archaeon]|nr:Tryptophan--tRNA ligase [uncultured archaeon]
MAEVTPWEVSGEVDYDKLVAEFGTRKMDGELGRRLVSLAGEDHVMLHRKFFFSHRDLDLVLKDYESKKGFFLYTGRGPSGPMHIGHLIPLIFTKWLQERFKVNLYIEITDDEKFVCKKEADWDHIQKAAADNMLDIAAVGFDPERTFIFKDSEYIKNVYPLMLKVAKKINLTTTRAVFGFNDQTNIGLNFYPAYQIIPTLFEKKRCLIPAAIDQDPYWRIQRDIAESLGFEKTAAIHSKFLPPLSGMAGKMSSSQADTAIWLTDGPKVVRNKVMKYAFSGGRATVEEHRKLGGNPDVDVAYQWLSILFEEDDAKLKKLHDDYKAGALLTGELKQVLVDRLNEFLAAHAKRREHAAHALRQMTHEGKLARKMWETNHVE